MVAMEPEYLLTECLPSLSPQQTQGTQAVEQRPISLFLRKLITFIPVNIEMVFFFFFVLPSFSFVWGGGEMSLPSYFSDELWGSKCRSCCRDKLQAVSRTPALHPIGTWLAVPGEQRLLAVPLPDACTLEKVLASL